MPANPTPYEILGVNENASDAEIKAAYRSLAAKYHPDKHATSPLADLAAEKFRQVKEAYQLLSDRERRAGYDSTRGNGAAGYEYESALLEVEELAARRMYGEAIRILDGLEARGIQDAKIPFMRGVCRFRQGANEPAYQDLRKAARLEPNDPEIQELVADLIAEMGRPKEALPHYEKALSIYGEAPMVMAKLALALELTGDQARSAKLFDRVRQLDPQNEILQARGKHWKVGDTYVNKQDAGQGACALCLLAECIFDCI